MNIITYFTESGSPKMGLSPTISVWKVSDNSQVVTSQAMSEIGGGFYKYNFAGYDPQEEYAIQCDGGTGLPATDRYTFGGNEGFHDDIDSIKDNVETIDVLVRRILGLSQENYRLFNTTYDISGLRLTGCTIKIYNNKTDCDNDQNAFARYTMEATYGMNGQLSSYKVVREATV